MQPIIIYTTPTCPYCLRAKALLQQKGAEYTEIDVSGSPALRQEMEEKSGRDTVPQIFIGSTHVGGCDDLYALDREQELDKLLHHQN